MNRRKYEAFSTFLALCSDGFTAAPSSWSHECGTVNGSPLNKGYLLSEPFPAKPKKSRLRIILAVLRLPTAVPSICTNGIVNPDKARWHDETFPSLQHCALSRSRGARVGGKPRTKNGADTA